ncbi:hypothetical protein N7493_009801 [Penicillium malachiteum]|uniref:Uncharacterized protein n=1 Tax=Penicillium malachiteum TaxID=1324776 RepID=A0AAD6HET1_9EURO|nr:hypothetical protein N7493_009801 [Penicillium malachiteum]
MVMSSSSSSSVRMPSLDPSEHALLAAASVSALVLRQRRVLADRLHGLEDWVGRRSAGGIGICLVRVCLTRARACDRRILTHSLDGLFSALFHGRIVRLRETDAFFCNFFLTAPVFTACFAGSGVSASSIEESSPSR